MVTLVLGVAFAFGIGAGDETMATMVGSGAMRLKRVVILAGILATMGALFLSSGVAQSIGSGLLNLSPAVMTRYQGWVLISILISVSTWLVIASKTGLPVSTTYSIIGAFIGIALCAPLLGTDFLSVIHWEQMQEILLGWIVSPILGLGCSLAISFAVNHFMRRKIKGLAGMEKYERVLMVILIFLACFNQVNRAGNDAGKVMGIFYSLGLGGQINAFELGMMIIIASSSVGFGLFLVGRHLLRNVGRNLIVIRPSDAICIETSMSIVLSIANMLAIPISGGQVLIFAIIGLALVKHEPVNKKKLKHIIYSWIITFPVAMISTAAVFSVLLISFGI